MKKIAFMVQMAGREKAGGFFRQAGRVCNEGIVEQAAVKKNLG